MNPPHIVILLATYNGALHLAEQLESLEQQTVDQIDILASDDGSTDATLEILSAAAKKWRKGSFDMVEGPRAGFSENFRSLILRANPDADYFAFCDQDDLWDCDKLDRAIAELADLPAATPGLYGSATRIIDEDGEPDGTSPIMRRPPSFRNALIQSIAGGNTMVVNRTAFWLLVEASRDVTFVSHDWWAYMIVSGAGGTVIYDPVPHVSYRQHGGNLVGSNASLRARGRRFVRLLRGEFRDWNDCNIAALMKAKPLLSPGSKSTLEGFAASRSAPGALRRAISIRRLGLYRQTWQGHVMLFLGMFLGKI